jgi:hypothetical protein
MNEMLVLGLVVGAIWLILLFAKVPASIAFFSLLVGQLLSGEVSDEIYDILFPFAGAVDFTNVQLGLLVLPLILTVGFMRGRVASGKIFMDSIPSLFVALVAVLLAYPFIPQLNTVLEAAAQGRVDDYKGAVIVAASISGLLSAWANYPKHNKGKKH